MATLGQFAQNIRTVATSVQRRAPEIQRKCAGAILQAVVFATPVGNPTIWKRPEDARPGYVGGRARANWFVGVGGAQTQVSEATDAAGGSTVAAGRAAMVGSTPGLPIHITNNLPYIVPLNEGHSLQAPAGFIEASVQAGVSAVQADKVLPS